MTIEQTENGEGRTFETTAGSSDCLAVPPQNNKWINRYTQNVQQANYIYTPQTDSVKLKKRELKRS